MQTIDWSGGDYCDWPGGDYSRCRVRKLDAERSILSAARRVYVSRIDRDPATGAAVTTFDLRLTTPNKEPVMNTAECHTIEHLGATFLRNHAEWSSRIVYFGPMGCRTGFYLVVFGEVASAEILPLVRELFGFVAEFEGEIPGAAPEECGNYLDQNLPMAKWLAHRYLERDLTDIDEKHLNYQG